MKTKKIKKEGGDISGIKNNNFYYVSNVIIKLIRGENNEK